MCQGPDDCGYSANGGRWQRTDRCCGRVGSAFTPDVGTKVDSETIPTGHSVQNGSTSLTYEIASLESMENIPVDIDELPPEPEFNDSY